MVQAALQTDQPGVQGRIPAPDITFPSDGRTGKEVVSYFRERGYALTAHAEHILWATGYTAARGVLYRPLFIHGWEIPEGGHSEGQIRSLAARRGYLTPPPDLAPRYFEEVPASLLRQFCPGMLVVMHHPIRDVHMESSLLIINGEGELDGEAVRSRRLWNKLASYLFL